MWDIIPKRDERKDIINKRIMKKKAIIPFLALLLSQLLFSQVQLTSSTNALRHGDILCKIKVPYVDQGEKGNEEFYSYDPAIQTQEDINNKYYYGDNKNEKKITLVGETGSFEHGGRHYNLNEDGSYSYYTDNSVTSIGGETDEKGLHIGQICENQQSDNLYGNYLGDHNPRND